MQHILKRTAVTEQLVELNSEQKTTETDLNFSTTNTESFEPKKVEPIVIKVIDVSHD